MMRACAQTLVVGNCRHSSGGCHLGSTSGVQWKSQGETGNCAKCRCIYQGNLSLPIIVLKPLNAQWWQANKWLSFSALTWPEHSGNTQAVSRFSPSSVLLYDLRKENQPKKMPLLEWERGGSFCLQDGENKDFSSCLPSLWGFPGGSDSRESVCNADVPALIP